MEVIPLKRSKGSGSYYRRKRILIEHIENTSVSADLLAPESAVLDAETSKSLSTHVIQLETDNIVTVDINDEFVGATDDNEHYSSDEDDEMGDFQVSTETKEPFDVFLRKWSLHYNIAHSALKPLMKRCNNEFLAKLPLDPRTLMRKCYLYCFKYYFP